MEHTPDGTPVGVDDPYTVAGVCDHLTDDGRCRFALTRAGDDPDFAGERRVDGYTCHVGADRRWRACPHYRSTTDGRECARCGLKEVRIAHESARPLVEEHHLSYGTANHENGSNADAGHDDSDGNGDEDSDGNKDDDSDGNKDDDSDGNRDDDSDGNSDDDSDGNRDDDSDGNSDDDSDVDGDAGPHEITVALCRWCHAKVHNSFARIDDDASPDPAAVAERESRRSKEQIESAFETANERYDDEC